MARLPKVARVILACAVLLGSNIIANADDSENGDVAIRSNRWAIFIDASNDSTLENDDALARFRDDLIATGILEKNALLYSASASDPQKRPTRENIETLIEALRKPNNVVLPEGKLRKDSAHACETMIFLTGLGVANDETGEAYFAPLDVREADIQDWNDPKLIPLKTLEDALLYTKEDQKPLERTFFVVALNSPKAATRDASNDDTKRLNDVDLKRLPTRGTTDEYDEDEEDVAKFAHLRIATKNAKFDDRLVGGFYNALRDGLEGSADVIGDQDGTVSADELATYLESTSYGAGRTVVVDRSGNEVYPICKARKKLSISADVFDKLAKTFTNDKYKAERESAYARAQALKLREKENVEKENQNDENDEGGGNVK